MAWKFYFIVTLHEAAVWHAGEIQLCHKELGQSREVVLSTYLQSLRRFELDLVSYI